MSRCNTADDYGRGSARQKGRSKGRMRSARDHVNRLPLVDAALLALSIGACLAFAVGLIG